MNDKQWDYLGENLSVDFISAWAAVTFGMDCIEDDLALFCAFDGC